ncbi:hypothetical protein [Solilutibacter silvestris]|uniref:hypothetical protein n=1 Tax=Solilutibacter silvestris TaxID=1645665 RepID=UPI0013FDDD2C|nr:hypothetical protein [Lysobacter silvestris]
MAPAFEMLLVPPAPFVIARACPPAPVRVTPASVAPALLFTAMVLAEALPSSAPWAAKLKLPPPAIGLITPKLLSVIPLPLRLTEGPPRKAFEVTVAPAATFIVTLLALLATLVVLDAAGQSIVVAVPDVVVLHAALATPLARGSTIAAFNASRIAFANRQRWLRRERRKRPT